MILFATDLDGTLVSHHPCADRRIAYHNDGTEWTTYISDRTVSLLDELRKKADIVPVTTRTKGSYLSMDLGIRIKKALVENGAILLVNGAEDEKWREESERLFPQEDRDMLSDAESRLMLEGYRNKRPGRMFTSDFINDEAKEHENKEMLMKVLGMIGGRFDAHVNGMNGISISPKSLSKMECLKRFMRENRYDYCISAGDSEQDRGMFMASDFSIGLPGNGAYVTFPKAEHDKDPHSFAIYVLSSALIRIEGMDYVATGE